MRILPHQSGPSRAQRGPDGQLRLPDRAAGEQDPRHVDAPDQDDERDRAAERLEGGGISAGRLVIERPEAHGPWSVGARGGEAGKVAFGRGRREPWPQACDDRRSRAAPPECRWRAHLIGLPDGSVRVEVRRKHPHYRAGRVRDTDDTAEDAPISPELAHPVGVAQQRHGGRAGTRVALREQAANGWRHPIRLQKVFRRTADRQLLGLARVHDERAESMDAPHADVRERRRTAPGSDVAD